MGLGLDYNEDLMLQLASRSGGNHIFVEDVEQLASIFTEEFKTVLSVVAQEVSVQIDVSKNVRPVRVLGREAEINGQQVITEISQIYSEQEQYIVLEVEVPATTAGKATRIASVSVSYDNLLTKATDRLSGTASVNFSDNTKEIATRANRRVLEVSVLLLANENSKRATLYFDKGDKAAALKCLNNNRLFIQTYATQLDSKTLREYEAFNDGQVLELNKNGVVFRKRARSQEGKVEGQRTYSLPPGTQR
jgi:Ca-activated chloride channel family protein